ncbi:methionine-rich copper-binding protein CopC [Allocatelliglobosispora scoriae]|uniref:Methionine-rich copper-binding protein CopC n=1 Tax=Allocatelliglobosispora scoriae TaxID=643052 RepID=A0A841BTF8_9ACTN|nr:copper resistance CopC family protein [Allocatelliglobosispora scoriae]MBB5870032.1 methionine-rich copper-binding protein CopC [Allocatelliglobosispora scoriae]
MIVAGAAVAALVATTLLLAPDAPQARVEATVTSVSPADGAVLAAPPATVELLLSAVPDPGLSHITVRDRGGTVVNTGELGRDGDLLRQPVTVNGSGDFSATYHVTLADGEELTGSMRFSVGTGAAPGEVAVVAEDLHSHGVDPLGATLLVIDGAALLAFFAFLWFKPRRRQDPRNS